MTYPVSYHFYFTAENEYGEVGYSSLITATVTYDCRDVEVIQKTSMPTFEDIIDDPSKKDFAMVDQNPVIVVSNQIKSKST